MLYGQIQKQVVTQSTPITLENLSVSEKERLVRLLFTGIDWSKAQSQFFTDSGAMIPQDEVRRLHDELFAYAEEAKPLVTVGKEIVDHEITKEATPIIKEK